MKKCAKCNIEKSNDEYYKRPNGSFRSRFCKPCESAISNERYYKNIDEIKKKAAIYRKENKVKIKERAKIYREKINHAAYSNEKNKEYRKNVTTGYVKMRLRAKKIPINQTSIAAEKAKVLSGRIKKLIEKTGEKICSICLQGKLIKDFYIRSWIWKGISKHSIDNVCKDCSDRRNKKYKK